VLGGLVAKRLLLGGRHFGKIFDELMMKGIVSGRKRKRKGGRLGREDLIDDLINRLCKSHEASKQPAPPPTHRPRKACFLIHARSGDAEGESVKDLVQLRHYLTILTLTLLQQPYPGHSRFRSSHPRAPTLGNRTEFHSELVGRNLNRHPGWPGRI